MQSCKGYCDTYMEITTQINRGHWDKPNASLCRVCEKYMITPLTKCPCCNTLLSKKPRSRAAKERLKTV